MRAAGQYGIRGEEQQCRFMRLFSTPSRGALETQLETLKQKLLQPILGKVSEPGLANDLTLAANEAAALAWYTGFPMLVFPTLFEEKITAAWKRWIRQQEIWSLAA